MRARKNTEVRRRPSAALAQAIALWKKRRFDEALRCFNDAVRAAPNEAGVLIDAGRAFGARYQMDRSLPLLAKALRLGSRRPDVLHAVGESYRMLGRTREAEAGFRKANRLAASPASALELARICERRHALDEAEDLIVQVLRSKSLLAAALLVRGRIERRRGEFDKAHTTLRQLAGNTSLDPKMRAEAYGELCTLLDAAGDYNAAWNAILQCKQLLQPSEQSAWAAAQSVLGRASRMIDALTKSHFERWRCAAAESPQRRMALLTGFPRSGTTLLEQSLDAHPDIVGSEEVEFFSSEFFPRLGENHAPDAPIERLLDELTPAQIFDARQLYLGINQALLGESIGNRLHWNKNPAMNLMIPAMIRVFSELKLVVALRDPRDVVISCFLRYLPINPVSVCFLTLERTVVRYRLDMSAWLKIRDMIGQWVEIRYENMVADLTHEVRRALAVLEVPWDDGILQYRTRATAKPVGSPSYEEVARPIFTSSIGRWQNYERQLAPVLSSLAPIVEALVYKR
jgi:tetratricopeptide (TPR) repeat protein